MKDKKGLPCIGQTMSGAGRTGSCSGGINEDLGVDVKAQDITVHDWRL